MKFSRGTGIVFFIILFFILAISFLVWSLTRNWDLADTGKYPGGLQYNLNKQNPDNIERPREKITVNCNYETILAVRNLQLPLQIV